MKYLCLISYEEQTLDALSTRELDALIDEAFAYDEVLRKSGHDLVSDALQPVRTATTVRIRNGKVSVTDGPFAETKEPLGGFILIDARDLDDAIRVASKIPPARTGSIEVGRFATSRRSHPRRLHREASPMCPRCLTTMALIAAGTTSTGGLTALAMKKLRATSGAKNTTKQPPSKET